jgi:hypothetical protein
MTRLPYIQRFKVYPTMIFRSRYLTVAAAIRQPMPGQYRHHAHHCGRASKKKGEAVYF